MSLLQYHLLWGIPWLGWCERTGRGGYEGALLDSPLNRLSRYWKSSYHPPPPPQGRRFLPTPRGDYRQVMVPGGGGEDTTADQPLTGAYYAEFMAGQLLAVG